MGTSSKVIWGAKKTTDLYWLEPEQLTFVKDRQAMLFDERIEEIPVDETMVESIMEWGVQMPIKVKRVTADGDAKILIIDGNQRVKATIEANKRRKKLGQPMVRIPSQPATEDDTKLAAIKIVTNYQRVDDTPMVLLSKLQRYLGLGYTLEEASRDFRRPVSYLKSLVKVADAPAVVKHAVDKGLPMAAAKTIMELSPAKQKPAIEKALAAPQKKKSGIAKKLRSEADRDKGKTSQATMRTIKEIRDVIGRINSGEKILALNADTHARVIARVLDWVLGEDTLSFPLSLSEEEKARATNGKIDHACGTEVSS